MVSEVQPDFSGKIVRIMVASKDPKFGWWSLTEPKFETQNGRLFLVGKLTDTNPAEPFWGRGYMAAVPWEGVQLYCFEETKKCQRPTLTEPSQN